MTTRWNLKMGAWRRFIGLTVFLALTSVGVTLTASETVRSVSSSNGFVQVGDDSCRKATKRPCQPLQFSTCFGVKLPYTMTSLELVNENFTQQQLQNDMSRWEGLRSSPRCWAVIQPLLCSFYMPKCQDDLIDLPSQELCKITRNPCRVIEQATKQWPEFLKCDDYSRFPPNCKNNEIRELKFNTSSKCMDPMKEVENPFNYYEGFEGCALKCQDPLFTDEDHEFTSKLIKYFGIATLFCTGLVIATFAIDRKSSKMYPSVIVLWVNAWYFVATLGWMVQFLPNAKEDIVCRKDATIRRDEPTNNENVFCSLIFFLIYFGSMSALAWLMVFAYVWNLTCSAVGRISKQIDKQRLYFHVWSIFTPIVLTIICMSIGKIDGSSIYGICFVGYNDPNARIFLVLVPVGLAFGVILIYLWKGTYRLLCVSLSSSDFISPQGRAEIKSNAMRVIIFTILATVLFVAAIVLQINNIRNRPLWESSLRESVMCKMNLTDMAECGISEKPDLTHIIGSIIVFFCGGLLVSSWAWTSASVRTWKRYFRRRCGSENSDDRNPKVTKHKLISQAYGKRHQLMNKGRLSLSLNSTHEDPVGLNNLLDPNRLCKNGGDDVEQSQQYSQTQTDANEEVSSDWAGNIPHLISRRGALVPPHSSNSVSCVSEDSRRPSCDSAMSELAIRHLQGSHNALDKKKSKRDFFRMGRRSHSRSGKSWGYPWRRGTGGSSSSLESNGGSQILPAITALIDKRQKLGEEQLAPIANNFANRKTTLFRELAIQTSIEKLFVPSKNVKACNLSSNLMMDKATQSSLKSLHEVGTQTKKSGIKNAKDPKKKGKKDKSGKAEEDGLDKGPANDPESDHRVLKLLTPN